MIPARIRGHLGLVLALGGLVIGAGAGLAQRQQTVPVVLPPPPTALGAPSLLEVHVVGWVVSPGVVSVPDGSLVVDAVVAAGGLRLGARVEAVNLAAPVTGGQQVVVPGPDDPEGIAPGGGAGSGLVAVNRASASDLETLPGVGPVLAVRIVAYREQHGPFRQIEDLLGVPGIGEAKLASIRDLITVQ